MFICQAGNQAHMGPHHVTHLLGAFVEKGFLFPLKTVEVL